ncbi:MAG: helix-turn-helix domain-containing protein, partial [Ignavibacteriales bacterium]
MIIDKIEVGKRLKLFAINYGGVTKLAQALEISGPNLSGSYISGKSVPGGELIARLMELGCDIDWLLTGKGNPKTITTDNDLINDFTMQEHGNRDLLKKDIAGRLNEYLETIKKRDSR